MAMKKGKIISLTNKIALNLFRFFCPPPCVYLRGGGWRLRKEITQQFVSEEIRRQKNKESDFVIKEQMELDLCSLIGIGEQEKSIKQDKLVLDFSKGVCFFYNFLNLIC